MADVTMTNVLELDEAPSPQSGDVLLLIRDGKAYKIGYEYFKGADGKDGATGQLDDVSVSRNRLVAILKNT